MFIFWKIKIGGVHLIKGFPNATRQRPEHSSFTTAARRQTAPPHHTHNFFWHGPRQRSRGEMPFLYLPFYFFAARTKCLYKRHLFPTTSAQKIWTSYVYYVPVVLLLLLPLFLSLYLSLSLFKGTSHKISPFLYLPFYFFAATTKCLYKRHPFPTSLLARIIFRFVTTGLILGTPLYATN